MPPLPLDEAGKYVAGAYMVFVALILVYVAIMAGAYRSGASAPPSSPSSTSRGARKGRRREDRGVRMAEVLALGSSTRPRRWSCASGSPSPRAGPSGVLNELVEAPEIAEAAAISTCNRPSSTSTLGDPVDAESHALTVLARDAEIRPTELVSHLYSLRAGRRRRPPLPGDRGARLDDRR